MDCGLNSKVLLQFRLKYRYRSLDRILVYNVGKFQLEIRSGRRSKMTQGLVVHVLANGRVLAGLEVRSLDVAQ